MASSNRHWPSMFKSKHCNTHNLQWQHDVNSSSLISNSCYRTEERAPEPKPRWNPKPEQIRILEAIFNSGMVNPPRDEIRRIRSQLQEYGQVGDANVFYWFQNRKSRSKHKLRHLQAQRHQQQPSSNALQTAATPIQTTSSSSSSEKSGSSKATVTATTSCVTAVGNASVELCGEPLVAAYLSSLIAGGGHEWNEMVSGEEGKCGGGETKLELESVFHNGGGGCEVGREAVAVVSAACSTGVPVAPPAMSSPMSGATQGDDGVIGGDEVESTRSVVVFINDVAFEVEAERLNVRAAFGETAVLLHSSGQPVLVDQWGVTLQPLHHGASYYVV